MATIWQQEATGWRLLTPSAFPQEAALHDVVEQAPHLLPLAGSPQLVVLGREVLLGGNYADLIAVEPTGRLAVIEIKLARNPEARRAVVAQILTYAAYLRGMDVDTFEGEILASHLQKRGYASLADAMHANDQEGAFDESSFRTELAASLAEGRFRLVLVLDGAPPELVRLAGYLEVVADRLVIDLVTISAFRIGEAQVVVPQRVDPERASSTVPASKATPVSTGQLVEGVEEFEATIDEAPEDQRVFLRRVTAWATQLERDGLVKLWTYHGKGRVVTLLPRLQPENVGLVTVYNERRPNGAYLQFWRSVITRRASGSLARVEHLAEPAKVGQGTTTREVSDDLLAALADAYREAAEGLVNTESIDAGA